MALLGAEPWKEGKGSYVLRQGSSDEVHQGSSRVNFLVATTSRSSQQIEADRAELYAGQRFLLSDFDHHPTLSPLVG
jgi:hypothetical protein